MIILNLFFGNRLNNIYTISLVIMTYDYDAGTLRCHICAREFISRAEAEEHYKDVHSKEITSIGE
jgi:hypothetical protein